MRLDPRSSMELLVVLVCVCLSEIPLTTGQDYYHDGREYIQDCPICSWGEEPSIPCGKTTKEKLLASPPKCISCLDGFYQRHNFSTGQCKNCTIPLDPNLEVKIKCSHRHQGTYECRDGYFEDHNSDCRSCCDDDYIMRSKRIQKCGTYMWTMCPEVYLNIHPKIPKKNKKRKRNTNSTVPTETTESNDDDDTTKIVLGCVFGFIALVLSVLCCCFRKRLLMLCTSSGRKQTENSEQRLGLTSSPSNESTGCSLTGYFHRVCKSFWSPDNAGEGDGEGNESESENVDQTSRQHLTEASGQDNEVETTESQSQSDDETRDVLESDSSTSAEGVSLAESVSAKRKDSYQSILIDGKTHIRHQQGGEKCHASPSNETESTEISGDSNVSYHKTNAEARQSQACSQNDPEADVEQERANDVSDIRKMGNERSANLNELMVKMSDDLKENDLEKIKTLYSGDIGEGVWEKATTALAVLRVLKERGKVNNVSECCEIFKKIGRDALATKYAEYVPLIG